MLEKLNVDRLVQELISHLYQQTIPLHLVHNEYQWFYLVEFVQRNRRHQLPSLLHFRFVHRYQKPNHGFLFLMDLQNLQIIVFYQKPTKIVQFVRLEHRILVQNSLFHEHLSSIRQSRRLEYTVYQILSKVKLLQIKYLLPNIFHRQQPSLGSCQLIQIVVLMNHIKQLLVYFFYDF